MSNTKNKYKVVEFREFKGRKLKDMVEELVNDGWDIVSHSSYTMELLSMSHVVHTIIAKKTE